LYAIARFILNSLGVETVLGGDQCSYQQAEDYFPIVVMQKLDEWQHLYLCNKSILCTIDSPCIR
jgi:hypothetical protein